MWDCVGAVGAIPTHFWSRSGLFLCLFLWLFLWLNEPWTMVTSVPNQDALNRLGFPDVRVAEQAHVHSQTGIDKCWIFHTLQCSIELGCR